MIAFPRKLEIYILRSSPVTSPNHISARSRTCVTAACQRPRLSALLCAIPNRGYSYQHTREKRKLKEGEQSGDDRGGTCAEGGAGEGSRIWDDRYKAFLGLSTPPLSLLPDPGSLSTPTSARGSLRPFATRMKCHLQILTTPTADTPGTTLLLHFDSKRYMIGNIAEGTQRATIQRKIGLLKVGDIFLTGRTEWGTVGGLLGMILTIADSASSSREVKEMVNAAKGKAGKAEKVPLLGLHGGKNLVHLLATARRFIFRKGMPLSINEFREPKERVEGTREPNFKDDLVNVWNMVIEPEEGGAGSRKRCHDEFSGSESSEDGGKQKITATEEEKNRQLTNSVVADMFDSSWRMDTLVTKKLSEVVMPAAIFIRNSEGNVGNYTGPQPGSGNEDPDIEVLVRTPWPATMVNTLPRTTPATGSMCYIVKGHPQRGKVDAKAAMALGVKGPSFRPLTEGNSITTADGKIVTPDMVMGPSRDGNGFAVIELPSVSYVANLISRDEWSSKDIMNGMNSIVWILGPGVLEDSRLQKFMKERSKIQHIVSSKDCCPNYLALESCASTAIRQHIIDPDRFPIPRHNNVAERLREGPQPYKAALPGLMLDLEPKFKRRDEDVVPHLDIEKVTTEGKSDEAVMKLAEIAQAEVVNPEYLAKLDERQKDIPSRDAEIITLGTGSALPSKYRNVSATLVRVPGFGNYLLDAGENTLGQIKRVFGEETSEVLRDLKAIWISHLHADHHLGTASVIKAWALETAKHENLKTNKLHLISHEGMTSWLREYSEIEDIGYKRVETIVVANASERRFRFDRTLSPLQQEQTGITRIQACSVAHCHGAAAVSLSYANGFKLSYSGDCRPSQDFIAIGQDSTLLIHEATFDDELLPDAKAKKHTTTSEALWVGRKMNARRILLTHFSQRYQKIPIMEEGNGDQVAIVAFDYMRVKLGDFAKVEAFKPALMKLYEEETGEMEERIGKKGKNK